MQKKTCRSVLSSFLALATCLNVGSFACAINQDSSPKNALNLVSHQSEVRGTDLGEINLPSKGFHVASLNGTYSSLLIKLDAQKMVNFPVNNKHHTNVFLTCSTKNFSNQSSDWSRGWQNQLTPDESPSESKAKKVWTIVAIVLAVIIGIGFVVGIIAYKSHKK